MKVIQFSMTSLEEDYSNNDFSDKSIIENKNKLTIITSDDDKTPSQVLKVLSPKHEELKKVPVGIPSSSRSFNVPKKSLTMADCNKITKMNNLVPNMKQNKQKPQKLRYSVL